MKPQAKKPQLRGLLSKVTRSEQEENKQARSASNKTASVEIAPVGFIESPFQTKFGTPRQSGLVPSALSFLSISKKWQPEVSLEGIEEFTHVWLVFWFHQNQSGRFHGKVHPPRLLGKSVGCFASRTPHRPNPIGLSLGKIEKMERSGLWLSGLDLVHGTPVLDIKPYLPSVDCIPTAKGGWTEQATDIIEIVWSEQALLDLELWQKENPHLDCRTLVSEVLKSDPRPLQYKKKSTPALNEKTHCILLAGRDLHFTVQPNGSFFLKCIRVVNPKKS